jgi:integrase
MASIINRDGRFRALVRKAGQVRCETFSTRKAAKHWADKVEAELEELRANGVMQPKGLTVADLVDRYIHELYSAKPWGKTKAFDLKWLRHEFGSLTVSDLNSDIIVKTFRQSNKDGAGGVTIGARIGYLIGVLSVARSVWHLDAPLQAAQDARLALKSISLVTKAARRDRRVSDAEITKLLTFCDKFESQVPYGELIRFALASGMRAGEICRIRWDDLNEADRTIIIRDRKHPTDKVGNDTVVPLLSATGLDAFAIIMRQPRDTERIFPIDVRTLTSVFPRITARLGLDDLHFHDLRHEAVSRLFEAGYQIQEVALVSGHRDWGQLRRYTHVRAKDLHRARAA